MNKRITRDDALARDASDPLRECRNRFALPGGIIYLDGNSLGVLPKTTKSRVQHLIEKEWGQDLIKSWNTADWINMPIKLGQKIARLIGANDDEVIVADSTSINIFKMVAAAHRLNSGRKKILSEKGNFPTDLYMLEGLTTYLGQEARFETADPDNIIDAVDEDTAVVLLTHVNYKSGSFYDMTAVTREIQKRGAFVVWDLSHSAGAIDLHLSDANADFAVGCGYKYLNGGPGAPAFLYVAKRHQDLIEPILSGWMGHAKPFEFGETYAPAAGVRRNLCGTPSIIALAALDEGLKTFDGVDMKDIRIKSRAMGDFFIALIEQELEGFNIGLASEKAADKRASQVSLWHEDGYPIMQALIGHGVIGDFRAPNLMRFGFTPLYVSYEDIWQAVTIFKKIMVEEIWRQPVYQVRSFVT